MALWKDEGSKTLEKIDGYRCRKTKKKREKEGRNWLVDFRLKEIKEYGIRVV